MRIFVTHISPKDRILEYGISLSASNFNHHLIEGGCFDKVYSIYPGFVKGRLDKPDDSSFEAAYSSWRWKGRLRQRWARVLEQVAIFRKIPRSAKVWYYNLTSLNLVLILLLKILKPGVQQNIIILDFTPDSLFNRCMLLLINRMHGRISLSLYGRFNSANLVCLPGVVPMSARTHPEIVSVSREFLLSGALKENITMLSMVLDAFAEMPELVLHVSGVLIDCQDKVKEYAEKFPNIHFYGKMPRAAYENLLARIPFSLNTRKPSALENLGNFPSKVIEALLYNRIVISTMHYPQLDGIRYFEVASDKEAFKRGMLRIASMPDDELLFYANQEQKVIDRFNVGRWNQTMNQIEKHP